MVVVLGGAVGYGAWVARAGSLERLWGQLHTGEPLPPAVAAVDAGPDNEAVGERAASIEAEPVPVPARYVAVGGGAFPENTEVSLEQDLGLLRRVFGAPGGALYFGGGPGAFSVRELRDRALSEQAQLRVELGQLFAPRPGRDSAYRRSHLQVPAAERSAVTERLAAEFALAAPPLWVYVAAHGEQAEQPADNRIGLWGGTSLSVRELAELHDGSQRPLRLVVTSCFSGGFAELAFHQAQADLGPSHVSRCGVFAGTADRETSGCDPDPQRRRQESYALHLLHALSGEGRNGEPLHATEVDLDGDGQVSLLEAHARARVMARSIDVPTSTSERYLRAVQSQGTRLPFRELLWREEDHVVQALGARLGAQSQGEAEEGLRAVQRRIAALDRALQGAEAALDDAYLELVTRLLARFPVLSDAYHPDFKATLTEHRVALASMLHDSVQARAYQVAQHEVNDFDQELLRQEVQEAQWQRLVRAYENVGLAAALAQRGGAELAYYKQLLECERAVAP